MKSARGYTLLELVVAIAMVTWFGFCIWMLSLMVRALLKYVGS